MSPAAPLALIGSVLIATSVHDTGTTLFDYITVAAIVAGAAVYVVMQVRDYRPNKRLRDDLAAAREDNDKLIREVDANRHRIAELEKSRDFELAFKDALAAIHETKASVISALEEHGRNEAVVWQEVTKSLGVLSTARLDERRSSD